MGSAIPVCHSTRTVPDTHATLKSSGSQHSLAMSRAFSIADQITGCLLYSNLVSVNSIPLKRVFLGSHFIFKWLQMLAIFLSRSLDHHILIHRLNNLVSISGTALELFSSYLTDRTFAVSVGEQHAGRTALDCRVSHGSVLCSYLILSNLILYIHAGNRTNYQ